MAAKDSQTIESGARAIIFLWIELQPNHAVPVRLRHLMTFSSAAPANGRDSSPDAILEDFPVQVGQDVAPVLSSPF